MKPIYKKFSVFYSTKLLHFTQNFCTFLHDEYLFKRFTLVAGTVVVGTN